MYKCIKLNVNKEIKSYIIGFLFSLILTIVPFLLVMNKIFSSNVNYIVIILTAVIQIIIHFIYFLDVNFSAKGRWNLITLLFVLIIIFIIVFGSIWIMSNLNHHMLIN